MHIQPQAASQRLRAAADVYRPLAPISVECRVDYSSGPSDTWRWALAPATLQAEGEPGHLWVCGGADRVDTFEWQAPESATLESHCHDILALHLFGAADMPPCIVGEPLWTRVAASLHLAGDSTRMSLVEIQLTGPQRALVRRRPLAVPVWSREQVALRGCDADPLRALLTIGLAPNRSPYVQVPLRQVRRAPAVASVHDVRERPNTAHPMVGLHR
jgi:hypothetical protein